MWNFGGVLGGYEEMLLDGIWMALLGVECLMVAGVVVRRLAAAVKTKEKVKAQ